MSRITPVLRNERQVHYRAVVTREKEKNRNSSAKSIDSELKCVIHNFEREGKRAACLHIIVMNLVIATLSRIQWPLTRFVPLLMISHAPLGIITHKKKSTGVDPAGYSRHSLSCGSFAGEIARER